MALVPDTLKSVRDSSGEVGIEWLAGDDRFEGSQQRYALLPEGGKIAPEAGEGIRAPG